MATITAGMTGAAFIAALNNNFDAPSEYNVKKYGVVGDGTTDDTAAIQALIETAKVTGGTLYFPPGSYKTHTLTLYNNVMLKGDKGSRSTYLVSLSSEPLINLVHTTFFGANSCIKDLVLYGAGIGTIGLVMQWVGLFHIDNVLFVSFLTHDVHLVGSLVGQFTNCTFGTTVGNGVYAENYAAQSIACNDVLFKGCQFYQAQKWAIKWIYGSSLILENCSFEINGTPDNSDSGCIYYERGEASTGVYWRGISVNSCWFEANRGTVVHLAGYANQEQLHTIRDTIFYNNNASGGLSIKMVADTNTQKLLLIGTSIADNNAIKIVGNNGNIINIASVVTGTITGTGYKNPIDINGDLPS